MEKATVIIVMGVAGSGKTTVGELLAQELGWIFADADSYHCAGNVQKMHDGHPLTDEDRLPWLQTLGEEICRWLKADLHTVLACSALREDYRHYLHADDASVKTVYLKGSYELLAERLQNRQGHFMKAQMLQSQFLILEEPKNALVVDAAHAPAQLVAQIKNAFVEPLT
jgi:gluconokinase